jgi:N-acetyl-alpha-D-glucosaminyl L-malate synthase BshA
MAMAERGHKVHFICYEVPRRLNRYMDNVFFHEVEEADYPLFRHPPSSLSLASKMVEVTQFEELDILHAHYAIPHATSAYLARQVLGEMAPKIITTLHGTDITLVGNDRSYLPIVRFSILQSDGITAVSKYLKNATYDKINISTETPIEVINNFVDPDKFRPRQADENLHSAMGLGDCVRGGGKTIVHISNFRPVKRVGDVVQVFRRVHEQLPSRLILIGDGPERGRIEREVRENGLSSHVCFLGKQESFADVLRNCDVFLLPSESESFGLAALEALSSGVPVIASNIAGIPELVTHGEVGYLSEVGDIDDMAANTIRLLTDKDTHGELSRAARERAIGCFARSKIVDQYEDYYYQVLSNS